MEGTGELLEGQRGCQHSEGGDRHTYDFSSLAGVPGEPVLAGGALRGEERGVSGTGDTSWVGWGGGGGTPLLTGGPFGPGKPLGPCGPGRP